MAPADLASASKRSRRSGPPAVVRSAELSEVLGEAFSTCASSEGTR